MWAPSQGNWQIAGEMTKYLYTDPPLPTYSYYSNEMNFTHIPESILASIRLPNDCAWLEGIIS